LPVPQLLDDIVSERPKIGGGLKADEVVSQQGTNEALVIGEGRKDFRRRERRMEEKSQLYVSS
jgi:hypothetical protein